MIHTCPGCDGELTFDEEDLQSAHFTNKFDIFRLDYVVCPGCGTIVPYRIWDDTTGMLETQFTFQE